MRRMSTTASVTIAPITLADVPGFHACLDAVAREQCYLAQVQAPPLERIEHFVREGLAADAVQFVARHEGQVIGWADIFPDWAAAVAHRGHVGMGLLPAWRGQRIGQRLLQACLDKARLRGLTRIELESRIDNHRAIALYERLGFRREALKVRAMRFGDRWFDTVQMSLLFD